MAEDDESSWTGELAEKVDDAFQRVIVTLVEANDITSAFRMLDKELNKRTAGVHRNCIPELKARICKSMGSSDQGILRAFGDTVTARLNSEGPLFRYPYSYILYGAVTPVKEGPGSAIDIYRRGLVRAEEKNDLDIKQELNILIQDLVSAEEKKAKKREKKAKKREESQKKKMDVQEQETNKVVVQGEEQETDKIVVQDTEEEVDVQGLEMEQQNEVENTEHEALMKKKEDESFPDFGHNRVDVPFSFTLIRRSGMNCYKCIANAGRFQVQKSLVTQHQLDKDISFEEFHSICFANRSLLHVESAFSNTTDGADVLVCEVASTLSDYCEVKLQKLAGELGKQVTKFDWWNHISHDFGMIFRDVIQGLRFLYFKTDYACGDLNFSIFVTEDGRGRVLPKLVRRNGREEMMDDIRQLKDAMKTFIAYPFDGDITNINLSMELEHFLNFDYTQSTSPLWLVIYSPFFWTVEERIRFPHNLKRLIGCDLAIRAEVGKCLEERGRFESWQQVLGDGAFKMILGYHEDRRKADPNYANAGYVETYDICRFFVATYSHLNDRIYKIHLGGKEYTEAEIEYELRNLYPDFYVNMFECLCLIDGGLRDEELKMLSSWSQVI